MLFCCKTNEIKINKIVTKEQFVHDYKINMIYKCLNAHGNDAIKQEIEMENNTPPFYFPPPPLYIKQFNISQDSIVSKLNVNERILFNCLSSFETREINELILKDYNKKLTKDKLD
jgi:hypothetical protein